MKLFRIIFFTSVLTAVLPPAAFAHDQSALAKLPKSVHSQHLQAMDEERIEASIWLLDLKGRMKSQLACETVRKLALSLALQEKIVCTIHAKGERLFSLKLTRKSTSKELNEKILALLTEVLKTMPNSFSQTETDFKAAIVFANSSSDFSISTTIPTTHRKTSLSQLQTRAPARGLMADGTQF